MSPFVLIVIVLVVAGGQFPPLGIDPVGALSTAIAQPLFALVATTLVVRTARRRIDAGAGMRALRAADRSLGVIRGAVLLAHGCATLGFGWVAVLREHVGDVVLLDELLGMAPPLAALVVTWWAWYPIERRLRDAETIARATSGFDVVHAPVGRSAWIVLQIRVQILLLLVPVMLAVGALESLDAIFHAWLPEATGFAREASGVVAILGVLLLSPVIIRLVLDARPLPEGPLRDDLMAICRRHRVRIADCLLWPTHGAILNGAVVGVLPPLRYVLLTDALLDELPRAQLHAVFAHEIGHLRRRHLPLSLVAIFSVAAILGALLDVLMRVLPQHAGGAGTYGPIGDAGITFGGVALVLLVFGFISRRLERQADTFAVVHLSESAGYDSVTHDAVASMCGALESVSATSAIDPGRRSWRHGSIRWRQSYLRSLVGRPTRQLPIDRQVRLLGVVSLAALALVLVWELWPRT